jgi:hypothetical protein
MTDKVRPFLIDAGAAGTDFVMAVNHSDAAAIISDVYDERHRDSFFPITIHIHEMTPPESGTGYVAPHAGYKAFQLHPHHVRDLD